MCYFIVYFSPVYSYSILCDLWHKNFLILFPRVPSVKDTHGEKNEHLIIWICWIFKLPKKPQLAYILASIRRQPANQLSHGATDRSTSQPTPVSLRPLDASTSDTSPAAVAEAAVGLLQVLHARLALLGRPGVAQRRHVVGDVSVDVAVVHARPQALLHVVRRPQPDQGHRLGLQPGPARRAVGTRCGGDDTNLIITVCRVLRFIYCPFIALLLPFFQLQMSPQRKTLSTSGLSNAVLSVGQTDQQTVTDRPTDSNRH